jgi:DegV family protein with EDD domain
MSRVKLVLDSTADVPEEWLSKYDIAMIPLHITWPDGKTEDDTRERDSVVAYWRTLEKASEFPKSSQPSPAEFSTLYRSIKREGYDEIVVLTLSSAMSGTYNSALIAARDSSIPVHVIDTKKASAAATLVAKRAREFLDSGMTTQKMKDLLYKEIAEGKVHAIFYVSNFDFLVKGGRVSKFQGFVGGLLNINVCLYITHDSGDMIPFKRIRGEKKAQRVVIDKISMEVPAGSEVDIMMVHAENKEGIDILAEQLREYYDIATFDETLMGKVISTHVGPGTAGFALYWRE